MYELYELITIDLRVIYELSLGVSRVIQERSKNSKNTVRVPYVCCMRVLRAVEVYYITWAYLTARTTLVLIFY